MGTNGPRSSSVHDEGSRRGDLSQGFKMNVGTDIESENSNWVFDAKVAPNFDKHVRESVPLYDYVQELAAKLSNWFILFNILVDLLKLYILLRAMPLSNRMRLCKRQHP